MTRDGPIADGRETIVGSFLAGLGSFCWRWPKSVVLVWLAAALVAGFAAAGLEQRLLSGSGNIAGARRCASTSRSGPTSSIRAASR